MTKTQSVISGFLINSWSICYLSCSVYPSQWIHKINLQLNAGQSPNWDMVDETTYFFVLKLLKLRRRRNRRVTKFVGIDISNTHFLAAGLPVEGRDVYLGDPHQIPRIKWIDGDRTGYHGCGWYICPYRLSECCYVKSEAVGIGREAPEESTASL